ncbi:hypothetical protein [Nonomuraea sp. NPDC048916]|uniref:hypothetical protein n=1 Tax=Nonomuraea sp. NPDC048916 TaxID=3154232 RepID=UPI0033F0D930
MSEHRPYSYVTLSMRPDCEPHVGVSFYTPRLRISSGLLVSNPRPYLELASQEANVHISTTGGGPVTDADLDLAREIFNAAARYLADCELLHTAPPVTDATDTAA